MTQSYVNGFFTKCAEHRVPYELAVAMYKHAQTASSNFSNTRYKKLNYADNLNKGYNAGMRVGGAVGGIARGIMGGKTGLINRIAKRTLNQRQSQFPGPKPSAPAQQGGVQQMPNKAPEQPTNMQQMPNRSPDQIPATKLMNSMPEYKPGINDSLPQYNKDYIRMQNMFNKSPQA